MLIAVLIDRNRKPSANLGPRMALFTVGAALALLGMASGRGWLVWVATVVLVVAFALRFGPESTVPEGADADEHARSEVDHDGADHPPP